MTFDLTELLNSSDGKMAACNAQHILLRRLILHMMPPLLATARHLT